MPTIKSDLDCRHAKTDKQQADLPVDGSPGLSLRVTKDGRKAWTLRYRRQSDGKMRRQSLGVYPDVGLADARERARQARSEVSAGQDPASVKKERRAAGTFADVCENWLRRHGEKKKSARTLYDDTRMLAKDVLPMIGGTKAADVARRDIEKMLDAISDRGVKVRANRTLALVRCICRWAVKRGDMPSDPTAGVDKPEHEEARDRVLSPDEVAALWKALDTAPMSDGLRIVLRLCLATGQRVSEVAGITTSELTLDGPAPLWVIPASRCKNGKEHRVPLSGFAVALIRTAQKLSGGSAWLFPNPAKTGSIDGHAATRAVSRMRGKNVLGVDNFRVHDLRRTAATGMGDLGFDDFIIGLVLNHSATSITRKVYNRGTYDEPKRKALEAWGARIEVIVGLREEPASNVITMQR